MRLALSLTVFVAFLLGGVEHAFGSDVLYRIASGGIVIMSAIIAVTFLWLWRARATPLALGMAFSWAGGALTLAWWWVLTAGGAALAIAGHPLLTVFVAIYTTGAVLHFSVIAPSLHWPRPTAALVPVLAFALSGIATYLT